MPKHLDAHVKEALKLLHKYAQDLLPDYNISNWPVQYTIHAESLILSWEACLEALAFSLNEEEFELQIQDVTTEEALLESRQEIIDALNEMVPGIVVEKKKFFTPPEAPPRARMIEYRQIVLALRKDLEALRHRAIADEAHPTEETQGSVTHTSDQNDQAASEP
jgi:hypothetical protein